MKGTATMQTSSKIKKPAQTAPVVNPFLKLGGLAINANAKTSTVTKIVVTTQTHQTFESKPSKTMAATSKEMIT